MPIPTIPGTAQVADTQIGSKVNVEPRLRALGQARQTFQQADSAIQGGIGLVQEYEERKRKAEEAGFFNKTSIALMSATSTFRHGIKTIPDAEIVPNWTTASAAVKQTQLEDPGFQKMSPKAQRELRMQLDKWQGQSTGEFQLAADRLGSQRRHATAIAASREFLKSGDPALVRNAETSLDAAVRVGDMTAEQADFYKAQFPGILQANQIRNGIDANAVNTLHAIDDGKFPDVTPNTLLSLRRQAEAQVNRNKVGAYQDIRAQQAKGRIYTKQELTDMADSEKIEGSSIDAILKAQKGDVTEDENLAAASRVHDAILDIPRNASPDQRLDSVVKIHGSKDYQSLTEQQKKDFDGALKPEKESGMQPIHRTQLAMMKEDFGEIDRRARMDPKDFRNKYGRRETQPNLDDVRLKYAKAQQEYIDWASSPKGQKATPEEATAERERLGYGRYQTKEDVRAALQAGKINRETAKQILAEQFKMGEANPFSTPYPK